MIVGLARGLVSSFLRCFPHVFPFFFGSVSLSLWERCGRGYSALG